tara:strand:+ start:269 stop:478 length:210 start_codon:yes stop_codon:yes gene_type:complete
MIDSDIERILENLKEIENTFSKEELDNTEDFSIRWRFYDIKNHLKNIGEKNISFRKNLETTIKNYYDWL